MYVIVCVYVLYIHCIYINITKKVSVLCIYIYIYLSIYISTQFTASAPPSDLTFARL